MAVNEPIVAIGRPTIKQAAERGFPQLAPPVLSLTPFSRVFEITRRMMRLAFLAPEIVEAIAAGHQPPELTAEALAERIDLPLLWDAQERAVGIS